MDHASTKEVLLKKKEKTTLGKYFQKSFPFLLSNTLIDLYYSLYTQDRMLLIFIKQFSQLESMNKRHIHFYNFILPDRLESLL